MEENYIKEHKVSWLNNQLKRLEISSKDFNLLKYFTLKNNRKYLLKILSHISISKNKI